MSYEDHELFYDVNGFEVAFASNSNESPLSDQEIANRLIGALDDIRYNGGITKDTFNSLVCEVEAGNFEWTKMEVV